MSELFLGLLSGTSADGIDAALVRFESATDPLACGADHSELKSAPEGFGLSMQVVAAETFPYPAEIRARLLALTAANAAIPLDEFGTLDVAIGMRFAKPILLQSPGNT